MRNAALLFALLLSACATTREAPVAASLPAQPPVPAADGGIYSAGQGLALFEDQKARRVGDVLTVLLVESTAAQNKVNSSTSKETAIGIDGPTLFGRPVTAGGVPILQTEVGSNSAFKGAGASTQSNSLQGSVSVTVVQVLPGGALYVRGQKRIELGRGSETVALEGVVRPQDIRPDNTITSDRVADARIAYGGRGAVSDAGSMGWLSRFFNSALFPF
jgi:flagellar L-ring protein precursor FlgH